jgi:hypothetical protein
MSFFSDFVCLAAKVKPFTFYNATVLCFQLLLSYIVHHAGLTSMEGNAQTSLLLT